VLPLSGDSAGKRMAIHAIQAAEYFIDQGQSYLPIAWHIVPATEG